MTSDVRELRGLTNLMVEYSQDYLDDYNEERRAFDAFIASGNRERTQRDLNEHRG